MSCPIQLHHQSKPIARFNGGSNKMMNDKDNLWSSPISIFARLEKHVEYNHYYYDSFVKVTDIPDYMLEQYLGPFLDSRMQVLRRQDYERFISDMVEYRGMIRPWSRGHSIGSVQTCQQVLSEIRRVQATAIAANAAGTATSRVVLNDKNQQMPRRMKSTIPLLDPYECRRTFQTIYTAFQGRIQCFQTILGHQTPSQLLLQHQDDEEDDKTNNFENCCFDIETILNMLRPHFTNQAAQWKEFQTTLEKICHNDDQDGSSSKADFIGYISGCLSMSSFICSLLVVAPSKQNGK
eukprot:scaffold1086_cov66-Cylindrotheca_fusiformis.AAC.2